MRPIRFFLFSPIFLTLLLPSILLADMNEDAFNDRIHLTAGTIWNPEGNGDCLLFPYFDVRKVDGKTQVSDITVRNGGEYGIAAKLRFRDGARGREIFSKDIWIPSKGIWSAKLQMSGDGANTIITGSGNVIAKADVGTFYFTNSLLGGASFSTKNIRRGLGESPLYGFVEVIGEEKTGPDDLGGKTGRLAPSEQDCPNTLMGSLSITRVEDGATAAYDAVAIGNFSRGQGSLFKRAPHPLLDDCEDSLDQLEFQLSKWEVFGPFSVSPSNQGKTSLIVTFPTKFFHYSGGRRINKINNPFEARVEGRGEMLKTSLSQGGAPLPADSEITLPYSVNVIGLYQGSDTRPIGVDNLALSVFSYDSGDAKLTSSNTAQRILIPDYEYFKELFTSYRGLPALGLILQENGIPDVSGAVLASGISASIIPAKFSAVWGASGIESILFPTFISGPSSGKVGDVDTYTTGGASSTVGNPIQYEIDWGDGTNSGWLNVGVTSAQKTWTAGGVYALRSKARSAVNTTLESKWSKEFVVTIESISPPSFLGGPVVGIPDTLYTYTTGGAATNVGNPVQYFFEWGDTTDSNWLAVGVTSAQKSWPKGGSYNVKARARDSVNTSIVSSDVTLVVNIDLISTPTTPIGPVTGIPGNTSTYMTGGASSNIGDPVEYQFDWAGDGSDLSPWQSSTTFTKTWTNGGTFQVRARARDATYPSIMSAWSGALTVNIDLVTAPTTPVQTNPSGGLVPGQSATYTTGGSTSNIGDPVQYLIDFGDGTDSGWLPLGTTSYTKTWPLGAVGPYNVRAKARDFSHPTVESLWSPPLVVNFETITTPNAPSGPTPVQVNVTNPYTVGGAVCSLGDPAQYIIYWGDGTDTGWLASGVTTANKAWTSTIGSPYSVYSQARCTANNLVISGFSAILSVTVTAVPSAIIATGGTPQSTAVNTTFPVSLQATVRDSSNNPVPNVVVTFTAPAGGASGTFPSGSNVDTALTDVSGQANIAFTANGTAGGPYTVTANTTPPLAPPASFFLTNTP